MIINNSAGSQEKLPSFQQLGAVNNNDLKVQLFSRIKLVHW